MSFASQSSPAQRVPAWKRLGLKLKGTPASGGAQPAGTAGPAAQQPSANNSNHSGAGSSRPHGGASSSFEARRKRFPSPTSSPPGNKRPRLEPQGAAFQNQNGRRSFHNDNSRDGPGQQYHAHRPGGETPALSSVKDQAATAKPKKQKPKKTKAAKPLPPPSLGEQHLEYLDRYKNDKAIWKFNTNSQTLLIKYVFADDLLPASHIDTFYEYIRDIKGLTRTRLLETARDIVRQDQKLNAGFGEKSAGKVDKAAQEKMQSEYDDIVAQFRDDSSPEVQVNANGKRPRRISEVEFVHQSANPDIQRRIRRRIRAENVAAELSDSESSTSSGGATTTTSASTSTGAGSSTARGAESDNADVKMEISEGLKKKKPNKKKLRSNMVDDDSSSSEEESEDESSSDATSSSSSEDESEDEEMPLAGAGGDVETSSSSSSSSSEEGSEEDDEDDDEDDDEEGNVGGGVQI